MPEVVLFGVGLLAGGLLWLGLVWIPRQLRPIEAIRTFAAARGARVRGDGRAEPLTVIGSVGGRAFTLSWQRTFGAGDVLLLGVDCAGADRSAASVDGEGETVAGGAALVTRWLGPSAEVLGRLDTILDAQAALAERIEADDPADDVE